MTNFKIHFSNPWLLLLLIPAIALALYPYFRLAKQYRRTRNRVISVVLHITVMVLSIALISGISFSYEIPNKENELLLLVDASFSNRETQGKKEEFIENVIGDCGSNYRVGVVKFGYTQTYAAELSNDSSQVYRDYLNSDDPDTSGTDVAAALTYAKGLFTYPQSAKIVLISDGIETDGNAFSVIRGIASEGIRVDVVSLDNAEYNEVQIVGVETPDRNVLAGETVTLRLSLQSNVSGNDVTITMKDVPEEGDEKLTEVKSKASKGMQTVDLVHTFDVAGMHELRFEVEVTGENGDTVKQNNSYFSYLNMQVFNRVLVIEKDKDESKELVDLMKSEELNLEVTVKSVEQDALEIPASIEELCAFDQVVLVNIANKDFDAVNPEFFNVLQSYVSDLGGGLFTVGGNPDTNSAGEIVPHAYLRSDMQGTVYQQMLPVRVVDYKPPVAVMIVVDTSGSMSSAVPQAKRGAHAVLDGLTSRDFCGVMTFSDDASETVRVLPVSQKVAIEEAINAIPDDGSGGTVLTTAIQLAGTALSAVEVSRRHMIIVTDGVVDNKDEEIYMELIKENRRKGITLSVVGVGVFGSYLTMMRNACKEGGGEFYNASIGGSSISESIYKDLVDNAVAEIEYGKDYKLRINSYTSAVAGITQPDLDKLPFKGYYGTILRDGAVSPLIAESLNIPIYAQWKYGKGSVGSFMSNLTPDWAGGFLQAAAGKRFVKNVLTGLFPLEEIELSDIELAFKEDNYRTQMNVFTPLDEDAGQTVSVTVTPKSEAAIAHYAETPVPVTASDGFTRFTIEITCEGLYEILVEKKDAAGNVLSSRTVSRTFSYSEEYNAFPDQDPIGEEYLAGIAQSGRGQVIEDSRDVFLSFEKTIKRTADPRLAFLIIAIVLFLLDIAVRKFKFKWIHEIVSDRKARKAMEQARPYVE